MIEIVIVNLKCAMLSVFQREKKCADILFNLQALFESCSLLFNTKQCNQARLVFNINNEINKYRQVGAV